MERLTTNPQKVFISKAHTLNSVSKAVLHIEYKQVFERLKEIEELLQDEQGQIPSLIELEEIFPPKGKMSVSNQIRKIALALTPECISRNAINALNQYLDADLVCEKISKLKILEVVEMLKKGYVLTPRQNPIDNLAEYLKTLFPNYSFNLYNNENWDNELFETKEVAIEEGRKALIDENISNSQIARSLGHSFDGELTHFFVGECVPASIPSVDIEDILERLSETAYEDGGEYAEDWLDNVPKDAKDDLCDKLNTVVRQWVSDNSLTPNWYSIENIERIEV